MRLVFAGTPDFAATVLDALVVAGHEVAAAYTQPDRPAGRGRRVRPGPVRARALALGIDVRQPRSLRTGDAAAALAALAPEALVVAAYGLILPPDILAVPAHGCINVHASLLPRWRGAAPIQRAILAGDAETGVSIMQMDAGMDTGPVLRTASCPIHHDDTAGSLHERLAALGARALVEALAAVARGSARAQPQDDALATLAPRIEKAEALLDWGDDATALARRVRAFDPWPVAFTELPDGLRLRVWRADAVAVAPGSPPGTVLDTERGGLRVACANGALDLLEVQPAAGRRMPTADFLNAHRIAPGARLGSS